MANFVFESLKRAAFGALLFMGATASLAADAPQSPCFTSLPLGAVKPEGWIREQMARDLKQGFAGNLDKLAREARSDIFAEGRNKPAVSGAIGDEPHWWNGESEGNWRAGFIRLAYLSGDADAMRAADAYVNHVLAAQDTDGYMGINAPELRYQERGELWTQACLFRGLLDYADLSGNHAVFDAVKRAADHTLDVLFVPGKDLKWASKGWDEHDLMFSDVMERLFTRTGDPKYPAFALWLYEQYSRQNPGRDAALPSLLRIGGPLMGHAVRDYEVMRVPMWLALTTGRADMGQAWRNAMIKVDRYTFPGGAAIGQEGIDNLPPDPDKVEFEYCDMKELQADFESALQKTGVTRYADKTEQLFFNDAQGARLADGSAITYLTIENRSVLNGKAPNGVNPQPRNKYSPTQADVAVCCNPNAAQVAALYVGGMWMKQGDDTLAGLLYGPCTLSTQLHDVDVKIHEKTDYPFRNTVTLEVAPAHAAEFTLLLRDPAWSRGTRIVCPGAEIHAEGFYWRVHKKWEAGDTVQITFMPTVHEVSAANGEVALQYGALLFAQPIPSEKKVVKAYPVPGFEDTYYNPTAASETPAFLAATRWNAFDFKPQEVQDGADLSKPFDAPVIQLVGSMVRTSDGAATPVTLVPLGNANILRRVTFPIYP